MRYEVLKECRISGRELKPGDVLVLDKTVTPARAEKGVKDGNLKAGAGHDKAAKEK